MAILVNTVKILNFVNDIACILAGPRPSKLLKYGKFKKGELIVVGNGPSLNGSIRRNVRWFNQIDKLCVNSFCLTKYFIKFKPKYYAIMDPNLLSKKSSQTNQRQGLKVYKVFLKKVNWSMQIFLPMYLKNNTIFEQLPLENPNVEVVFVKTLTLNAPKKLKYYCYKNNYAMPLMYNVLVAGIYIGLNLGYKKIFVVGADHSWHKNIIITDNNTLLLNNHHFYDVQKSQYYIDTEEKTAFKMSNLLLSLSKTFLGYEDLEEYSKQLQAKIYNASGYSFIDAFERYNFLKK